ncbi:MAG: hypothetical protein ACRDP3_12510 [Streptomyces sp.]|uniref:hypothetical protein n=1 Tax=Streptomyces sp. TaxID=1931 RepID=UPI003D6A8357
MEFDEVAAELYGLLPPEFTAARNDRAQRARTGGQRELAEQIRGLRRPTAAAWASNLLVREEEQVAPLLRLGRELRAAHRDLDGTQLRALSRQQRQLVNALSRQAAQLASAAGAPIGAKARQEVEETLHAVLADPDAAREWATGRLSRPLSAPVGFDAAAREAAAGSTVPDRSGPGGAKPPRTGAGKSRRPQEKKADAAARRQRDERARQDARRAADEARRVRQEAEAAERDATQARAGRQEAEELLGRLRGELREAEENRSRSRERERAADQAERAARRAADDAERRARRLAERTASGERGR